MKTKKNEAIVQFIEDIRLANEANCLQELYAPYATWQERIRTELTDQLDSFIESLQSDATYTGINAAGLKYYREDLRKHNARCRRFGFPQLTLKVPQSFWNYLRDLDRLTERTSGESESRTILHFNEFTAAHDCEVKKAIFTKAIFTERYRQRKSLASRSV